MQARIAHVDHSIEMFAHRSERRNNILYSLPVEMSTESGGFFMNELTELRDEVAPETKQAEERLVEAFTVAPFEANANGNQWHGKISK